MPNNADAMAVLKKSRHITVRELPERGIGFEIDGNAGRWWILPVTVSLIGGILAFIGLYVFLNPPEELTQFPLTGVGLKLLILGGMCFGSGPVLMLIRLVQGPPGKVLVEAWPGKVRADRKIAGDRTTSTYGGDEIEGLMVEGGYLWAIVANDPKPLVGVGNEKTNSAIAKVMATRLWDGQEIFYSKKSEIVSVYPVFVRTKRHFWIPDRGEGIGRPANSESTDRST